MKKIYTDKDIEELHHSGVKSLRVMDDVVLTDLAYEKAGRLGIELVTEGADAPLPRQCDLIFRRGSRLSPSR